MLTSDGVWRRLDELAVGDRVFAPSGEAVTVTKVQPIPRLRPMYRLRTGDGRSLVASESHLWTVKDTRKGYDLASGWETLTTAQIIARGLTRQGKEFAFRLPHQEPLLGLPEQELPIPPYVLGVWLGDGTSQDGTITTGQDDRDEMCHQLEMHGATVVSELETRPGVWRLRLHVGGTPLRVLLREQGLLGNKHVPERYLTASSDQRLALLRGMVDTDGDVNHAGRVKFVNTREALADAALFVARSLGWDARKWAFTPKLNGRECAPAWAVGFTPQASDAPPASLPRLAERCGRGRSARRYTSIVAIEPVDSEPSRCIAVDSEDRLFLAGRDLVPTHNTTMARAEALILCLSNAGDEASVVLRHLRMLAHAAIGDPDGINAAAGQSSEGLTEFDLDEVAEALEEDLEDLDPEDLDADPDMLFLAEWSSTPGCDPRDRDEWCWSNPALGHPNGITERAIVGALKADDLRTFREENLCQWNDGVADGPFPPGSWEQGQNVPEETPDGGLRVAAADELQGPLVACVDMSVQRAHAWIAVGGFRADGLPQVEIVAKRAGDEWVREWLLTTGLERGVTAVTGQAKGAPISPLIATLEAEVAFPIDVVPLAGADLLEAFAWTFDAVRDGKVRHNRQGPLDRAAGTAKTNTLSQGAKLLDRRHADIDVAPLQAFIGAYWLLARRPAKPAAPPPQLPLAVHEAWDDMPGHTLTGDLNDIEF